MSRVVREGTRIVVAHEIDEVDVGSKTYHIEVWEVFWACRHSECQEEVWMAGQVAGVVVEFLAEETTGLDEVSGFLGRIGVLPIDIQTVESEILEQLHACPREVLASRGIAQGWGEVRTEIPAAKGKEGLHVAVGFLLEVELFEVAVDVGGCVVCWVDITWVSLLDIGIGIGERGFACFVVDACEGVENVGEFR